MDLKGSLVDTNLKIYPSEKLINFMKTIPFGDDVPDNILKFNKSKQGLEHKQKINNSKHVAVAHLSNKDIENLNVIKEKVKELHSDQLTETTYNGSKTIQSEVQESESDMKKEKIPEEGADKSDLNKKEMAIENTNHKSEETSKEDEEFSVTKGPCLFTSDVDWLYTYIQKKRSHDKDVPYLHELFEGTTIDMPENETIKRNPILEARCKKLRAQQEAREYRKMTKGVDNVRMRFPEDSIAYQLKQVNRQLIAVAQFIISIFAGFLFGFKGVEWMVGNLDFGFRLLLGVMIALVIALAEIYFLAKKLNEELNVPETTQLGGPPKFADTKNYPYEPRATENIKEKEHKD